MRVIFCSRCVESLKQGTYILLLPTLSNSASLPSSRSSSRSVSSNQSFDALLSEIPLVPLSQHSGKRAR
jgi:hypothetical protein